MPSATLRVVFSSPEPRPMGRTRYRFGEAPFPHFLTCTVVGWLPVFTRPQTVQIVLDSWRYSSARNYAHIESLVAVTTDW